MVVQHNLTAINCNRQLGIVSGELTKSAEKLSSGYKINRAADDAAGLSISEKMRKQIRGLTQGVNNSEDGISLCQVADGALAEVTEMIHRISELSVKSANGTNSSSDRQNIQDEVSQIIKEIDRIGDTTKFNELYIFKGDPITVAAGMGASKKPQCSGKFFQLLGDDVSKTGYMEEPLKKSQVTDSTSSMVDDIAKPSENPYVSVHADFKAVESKLSDFVGTTFFVNCCTDCCPITVNFTDDSGVKIVSDELYEIGMKKSDGTYYDKAEDFVKSVVDGFNAKLLTGHVEFAYKDSTLYLYDVDNNGWSPGEKEAAYFCDSKDIFGEEMQYGTSSIEKHLWIQSGADAGDGLVMKITPMNAKILGLDSKDVLTVGNAEEMIKLTDKALRQISANRSRIGAQQNRLEHTIANENNIIENTTAAESQIRDTDMATEMVKYANNNVLSQAGQSMLAQANQTNQGVMQLIA